MNILKKCSKVTLLTCGLFLLLMSAVTRLSRSADRRFTRNISGAPIFSNLKSQPNDTGLVDFVKNKFLIPPSNKKLNFSNNIWSSPVAKQVIKILKNQTGGFFIECGAYNGEWLSNTIELEHYLKWEGLLIEADPKYQAELLTKNRKAWFAPACLSPKPYPMTITMQRHKEWPAMSNIPELFYGKTKPGDFNYQFEVQCFPLYTLLLAVNRTVVDYMSLDVEGAEWSILQTIPFDKLTIKVLSLEISQDFDKSFFYLQSLGYVPFAPVKTPYVRDAIFVHKSVVGKT